MNETARLWIPKELAFGSEGKGGPPTDIVIDVTLYGLKRGQPAPPQPTELSVPEDAVIEQRLGGGDRCVDIKKEI